MYNAIHNSTELLCIVLQYPGLRASLASHGVMLKDRLPPCERDTPARALHATADGAKACCLS